MEKARLDREYSEKHKCVADILKSIYDPKKKINRLSRKKSTQF